MALTDPTGRLQTGALALLALGMMVTVGTALGFQHLAGYLPCKLCVEQRTPYYIGAPIMALGFVGALMNAPALIVRGFLLVGALLMTWSLYLAVFHAGVEWGFWPGPTSCTGTGTSVSFDQLNDINAARIVPCDVVQFRFLGLSLAGYNTLISLAVVALLGMAMFDQWRRQRQRT